MALKRIAIILAPMIIFGCGGEDVDALREYRRALREVPRERWEELARKKIFFGHQSVGSNILDGLKQVMKTEPIIRLNIRETADPAAFSGPIFAHFPIGQNRDPKGKIDVFRRVLESGIGQEADIAFFKLCFVDIFRDTDIDDILDHYDRTLANLATQFPDLMIIPVTVPLTNLNPGIKGIVKKLLGRGRSVREDNVRRNLANTRIKGRYGSATWGLAEAEAATSRDSRTSFKDNRGTFLLMNPDFTSDGGHLNEVGSQVLAIDLLLHLASLTERRSD